MGLVLGRTHRSRIKELLQLDGSVWQDRVLQTGSAPSFYPVGGLYEHVESARWHSELTPGTECVWKHVKISNRFGKMVSGITQWSLQSEMSGMPDTTEVKRLEYRKLGAGLLFASAGCDIVAGSIEAIPAQPAIKMPLDTAILQQMHAELQWYLGRNG